MAKVPQLGEYWIYGLACKCHPKEPIRYIGQTSQGIEYRLYLHKNSARSSDKTYHVYNWIRQHGEDNIYSIALESCSDRDALDGLEVEWIANTRLAGISLTNHAPGGSSTKGFKHTEASRRKMSESKMGKRSGPLNHNYGKPMNPETKAKMIATKTGVKWTPERRAVQTVMRGSLNKRAKLTEEDVIYIRNRYAQGGISYRELGEQFGVYKTVIHKVVNRISWKHI